MLDTCVLIDLIKDSDVLDKDVISIIKDYSNTLCVSFETIREMIVLFNIGKLRGKGWNSSNDVLRFITDDMGIVVLPLTAEVADTYSRLELNVQQNHKDPSDHIIISHAITNRITLISSDTKFPFYCKQGLSLIVNRK
ncbi:MAG: type II toxin-antitoxin system VapC family toxin [Paludibacteraceae bacterium]|nr:type II toxin-antitoxin system VapC family toxin [Paludibacteraceae bacterium]